MPEKLLNMLSAKKKIIEEISGYILYKNIKIGEGGDIEVFYGVEKGFKIEVAIKIQKQKLSLVCESLALDNLMDVEGIPNKYILIENLFGPSLKNILSYQKEKFDLYTISEIGIQIISILIKIHEKIIFIMISSPLIFKK